MTQNIKSLIYSYDISNTFFKHSWFKNPDNTLKYDFCFRGEIADYYLKINLRDEIINFNYILDFQITLNKTYDLLKIINCINKISDNGYFFYDFSDKKIKFKADQILLENKYNRNNLKYYLEKNLSHINSLFHKFALAIHNLIYGEIIEQNFFELLFLNAEGNA